MDFISGSDHFHFTLSQDITQNRVNRLNKSRTNKDTSFFDLTVAHLESKECNKCN